MAGSDGADFVMSRIFAAPRPRVWEAWTRPEILARWFGPRGTTTTVLRSELRPGGLLHFRMVSAEGGTLWGRFVYREIAPPERLVWVHAFSDATGGLARSPFPGAWPLELLNTVVFEATGGSTRVTLTSRPIEASEAERRAFTDATPSMQDGWGSTLDRLDPVLAEPG